jgi:hypothetical protein
MDTEHGDDWISGYRAGFVKGYEDGVSDGRFQGFKDAKHLAFQAAKDDPEMQRQLSTFVGEE